MYKKTRLMVRKCDLEAYLRGVNRKMTEMKCFFNVEVKQHKTKPDCVWVLIG